MITFHIESDGAEFHAWCSELPGCHTHGRSVRETLENLKDAAGLYLETLVEAFVISAKEGILLGSELRNRE